MANVELKHPNHSIFKSKLTMQNYSSLNDTAHHDQDEQAILFHVAEPTRSKWTHIEDLDSFFTRMYKYHQRHGFLCMLLQDISDLAKFAFVVILTAYLFHGINYNVLFGYSERRDNGKVTLGEVILPLNQCIYNFTLITWCMIVIALIVLVLKFLTRFYQTIYFWDIKQFYNTALGVSDDDLDNLTWSDIIGKIKDVQLEIEMCIHKRELTELDIYHRILRQENYMVAMVNKRLLPPRFHIPFMGDIVYWTKTLRYNIQGILFWSPWSPFENPWQLREEYKKTNLRIELANELGRQILWLAVINLCLAPVIFLWQILYSFYSYGELIKREPGRMGMRNWSMYSKVYFRHFNELDHELHARLTRAYRPAAKYLAAFSSPLVTVIAQYIGFVCGSLFTVILALTIYDEDVIAVEHVITIMTILGGLTAVCRSLIPEDTTVWCPEQLLECVVMHTHYLPSDWKGNAHTSQIREQFQELFQMSVVAILEDLLSPLITPYVMWRWMYPRSLEIVDFFRNFTVSIVGVGDVCSFAEMDVTKHGNPLWQADPDYPMSAPDQYQQSEDGKVELSLVHFAATNPNWIPPRAAQEFIDSVQDEAGPLTFDSEMQMLGTLGGSANNINLAHLQAMGSSIQFEAGAKKRSQIITRFSVTKDAEKPSSDLSYKSESNLVDADSATTRGLRSAKPEKSVVWFTPGLSSDDSLALNTSLKDKRKSVAWLEGPDLSASSTMTKSTMVLQKRQANAKIRSHRRSTDQETTPLLSERRPSR